MNPFKVVFCCAAVLFSTIGLSQQFSLHLNGTVYGHDGHPVSYPVKLKVELLDETGALVRILSLTTEHGQYSARPDIRLDNARFVRVTPYITDINLRSGVSVLDLVSVQNHILGIQPFTNALQLFGADVNNSQSVNVIDLVDIRKGILGLYDHWPQKELMYFFHRNTQQLPQSQSQLLSPKVLVQLASDFDYVTVDYWAVKTGDVH